VQDVTTTLTDGGKKKAKNSKKAKKEKAVPDSEMDPRIVAFKKEIPVIELEITAGDAK
jgi:hypothetical protein